MSQNINMTLLKYVVLPNKQPEPKINEVYCLI